MRNIQVIPFIHKLLLKKYIQWLLVLVWASAYETVYCTPKNNVKSFYNQCSTVAYNAAHK